MGLKPGSVGVPALLFLLELTWCATKQEIKCINAIAEMQSGRVMGWEVGVARIMAL